MTAPIVRKSAKKPNAAGRLNVTAGIRLPCTADWAGRFVFSLLVRSVPHTKQRVASSLTRVPQVGQSLVGVEDFSGLISFFCRQVPKITRCVRLAATQRLYQPSVKGKGQKNGHFPVLIHGFWLWVCNSPRGILPIDDLVQYLSTYSVLSSSLRILRF